MVLGPLVAALGAADAVVDVLARDLPPGALGDLAQGQELSLRGPGARCGC